MLPPYPTHDFTETLMLTGVNDSGGHLRRKRIATIAV